VLSVDWLAGTEREREREKSRQGRRAEGEERERRKARLCVLQPILELRHRSLYTRLHSTRTHTTILFFDPCHDLFALCQSFQLTKGGENPPVGEESERDIKRGERPLIDNASRLVTSHMPLISSPPQESILTWSTWFPHPCPSHKVRKEGSHRERPCTLPSRSSCHIYHIGPCSRYPRESLAATLYMMMVGF
jgi:hypothetical protein